MDLLVTLYERFEIEGNYERITAHAEQNWGKIKVDEFHANVYFTAVPECLPELAINAISGGEYQLYHIHRNVGTQVAKGNPNGFGCDALLGFDASLNFRF